MRALGIYQYLVKSQDPVLQAQKFVALVGVLRPGEFAVLDLEEGDGDQSARAEAWFEIVDATLTYPGYAGAWLYSGQAFFKAHGLMAIANSSRHTWVAAYAPSAPTDVPHTLWQHTDKEAWAGVDTCDCSIFSGDVAGLLAKISTPVPAPPA